MAVPSNTLNMLLSGLKHYMVRSNPDTPNFLDEKDPRFSGLRGTREIQCYEDCERKELVLVLSILLSSATMKNLYCGKVVS